ncbi:hypothetical protein [Actinoplanes siamensis]|uniref:hypothetical protein n=1 Tax=Actinoplanes siamensis TaxID=1223317 RepID=UPI001944B1DD|nr:hypothetical protein [Actinoplanes siamensis]
MEDVVSDSHSRRIQALELLYDHAPENAGEIPHFVDLLGETLDDHAEDLWRGTLRLLDGQGLIKLAETMGFGGNAAYLTDAGRAEVEERRRRRANPAEMRSAAERGILQYLYQEDPHGTAWTQLRGDDGIKIHLEGSILPDSLVGRVAEQLKEAGLIEGGSYVAEFEGPLTARLTGLGQRCIESGVSVEEFLNKQRQAQPGHVFHIGTISGSNLNWGDHVTQNATTSSGLVGDELRQLVQAIVQALPVLGLPDEDAEAIRRDSEVIEGELQHQTPESKGIVRAMLNRNLNRILAEGENQLALYLVASAKVLLRNIGWDVE